MLVKFIKRIIDYLKSLFGHRLVLKGWKWILASKERVAITGLALCLEHEQREARSNSKDREVLDRGWLSLRVGKKLLLELPLIAIPIRSRFDILQEGGYFEGGRLEEPTSIYIDEKDRLRKSPIYKINPALLLSASNSFFAKIDFDGVVAVKNPIHLSLIVYGKTLSCKKGLGPRYRPFRDSLSQVRLVRHRKEEI
jgi:hypothetical protein